MDLVTRISEALQRGDNNEVAQLTAEAIGSDLDPQVILDNGLIAGMDVIGERFRTHEIFLPEVLLAARAMYAGLDRIEPLLASSGVDSRGKVVIGTIQGDLHDIGKNLVGIMLRGAGFQVIDLGNDVSPEDFVRASREEEAQVIGMSALLTTTMSNMGQTIELLAQAGLQDEIHAIIGGAPVSEDFADQIGAAGYGYDGLSAVELVKRLL
ncbi:corrinoid protein [Candidatus Zixiibacteriota bacterium]